MKNQVKLYLILLLLSLQYACNQQDNPFGYQSDAHGRGKATILIEESFKRLFETSIDTFEGQYPKANIVPRFMPEGEVIKAFFNDESKTIVISREFTKEEIAFLKSKQIEVRSDRVAVDAVAIIVHPSNTDTLLTVDELKEIVSGKQQKWKGNKQEIKIVYDNINSANYNYLKNFTGTENTSKNVFALKSNEEVINYVKKTPNAVGVIGLNWISDEDDADVLAFLSGIKVVALAEKPGGEYYKPYSGLVYTKEYPLTRDIWMINKGRKAGLNTGFVLFMIGERGQTIVQVSGLVPASAPVRLIQFKEE